LHHSAARGGNADGGDGHQLEYSLDVIITGLALKLRDG